MMRFGPFEVNFTTSELRKSGTRVRIQEQPLRILETLLARRGQLVTREELRERLWPSGTFVDFDGSLNAAVGKLRQSLGDSAERPRYVETVARKGYRFIASVTDSEPPLILTPLALPPAEVDQRPAQQITPSTQADGFHRSRWAGLGAVASLCLVLVWLARITPRSDAASRVVLLDLDVGSEVSQPVISPDGLSMAFIAGGRLAVRQLDRPKITPLPGTEGASWPFFSPDGKWVG